MKIWSFIESKLKNDVEVILMVVIDNHGSSPGRKGFKMAVAADGDLSGSIGGGVMEYQLVERARKFFVQAPGIFSLVQDHKASRSEKSSGMICSGSQQIAFYPLGKTDVVFIEDFQHCEHGFLVFSEDGIEFIESDKEIESSSNIISEQEWTYIERLGYAQKLYVFGAGHVSIAVSKLFRDLGFHITVFDNRDEQVSTFKNNNFAHKKEIIDYKNVADYIPEGDHIYVMIMTFAHKADQKILSQLLEKEIKYLGMMGSREKVDSIYSNLKKEGVQEELLKKIDAPIGIPIKSQTPEEIAVSIAAKVILVKNR